MSLLFPVYSCALLRDILLQGRLYISRNWLCFYANLFGKDIKVGMTDGRRLEEFLGKVIRRGKSCPFSVSAFTFLEKTVQEEVELHA